MSFHQPSVWALLLLLVLPLLWWRSRGGRRRIAVAYSALRVAEAAGTTWAVRLRALIPVLRSLVIILLIVAVARPRLADERSRIFTEGIAIQLVVDRSGSMLALDFELDGRDVNRLEAVKRVVEDFVAGTEGLPGRPDDFVGLITFATFADSVCPLTLDHDHLVQTMRETAVSQDEEDLATALGDAIALGVERIRSLDERTRVEGRRPIKSKVMIVLTDGENNTGDIDPELAAEMASAFGIRVYTIGAGTRDALAPVPTTDPFGRRIIRRIPVSIDEDTLRTIAAATGGKYFRATDSSSLRDIYAQIDSLERTEIEQRRYAEYTELGVQSGELGPVRMPPILAIAFALLALELVLSSTRLRRVP